MTKDSSVTEATTNNSVPNASAKPTNADLSTTNTNTTNIETGDSSAEPKTTEKDTQTTEKNPSVAPEAPEVAKSAKKKSTKASRKTKAKTAAAIEVAVSPEQETQPVQPLVQAETPKTKKSGLAFRSVVIALLSVSLVTSAASLAYCIWDFFREEGGTILNFQSQDGNSANFTEGSIADVASKVTPGVVSIVIETKTTGIFGQVSTATAAGTGMIVTKDGYVLTNKHVVDGATSVQVVLDDGTTYDKVEIVGTDPLNDVAFLKIKDASNLPTVTLGNSKTITAGQQVIAIGNALGQFQNTITQGIISGTGRAITATSSDYSSSENLTDLIQTDAAINAGNSGGPLVNAAGEVIGINTATSTDADGIGFAIPISSVKGMLKNIIDNKSADRAYLGVYYVTITPDVAKAYNLPVSAGAYVYSPSQYSAIVNDGPAAKAGLKDKDIILAINDVKVGKAGSVSSLIGEYAPGETVHLTILRDGKESTIDVTLGGYSQSQNKNQSQKAQ